MRLNPYLMFNGDCEAAFKLYERVTGGKIVAMIPYEGSPAAGHAPAEWQKKILHARIEIQRLTGARFGHMDSTVPHARPAHQERARGLTFGEQAIEVMLVGEPD